MEDNVSQEYIDIEEGLKNLDKEIEDISCANINSGNVIDIVNEDIKKLDIKVRKIDLRNFRKALIRKVKILGKWVVRLLPYIVVIGLAYAFNYYLIKDIPFYRQPEEHIAVHEMVITKGLTTDKVVEYLHNKEITSSVLKNKAYYTTSWIKDVDGNYHREIKEYDLDENSQEVLENIANNKGKNLLDVLYRYKKSTEEVKSPSEITPKELESEGSVRFVCHYSDEEDIIIEAQSVGANTLYSTVFFVIALILSMFPVCIRAGGYFDSFLYQVGCIKDKYKKEDIEELKKLLKEKKLKFELVKRDTVTMIDPITKEKTFIK